MANPAPLQEGDPQHRSLGGLLVLAIIISPILFGWFTLRRGHSLAARVATFIYMGFWLLVAATQASGL
jgi:hypothetical protein